MNPNKKVVLAYSGGLDTSVAIKWLRNKGYNVIAYMADVGQGGDFKTMRKRALAAGASKVIIEDLKEEFVKDFIFPALKANAVYESKYFLGTALSRPLIAKGLVSAARREKAGFVAHGCTGKGNDQIRFEVSCAILEPKIKTIAPVREWEFGSREDEIRYAQTNKIPIDVTKKTPYSIDKNLWGVSIECGVLENPWIEPPQEAYQLTKHQTKKQKKERYIEIHFEAGIPIKLDGAYMEPVELVNEVNNLGAEFCIGRSDMVENRLVGIKSREVYEAPAATILVAAHKDLEALTLDRETAHFKDVISLKYGEMIYYGLWYTPLKKALDKFVDETQRTVTGIIRMKLESGRCVTVGRKSTFSLYKEALATYTEKDKFDQRLAKGFIEIWGMPYKK
ncbi:MAG: argininosuccinate synthase [Candidatus Omnitrophica bacterium]|nr:argininosuccinate synthase [Candidatus Omnitrophota bacterium]